MTHIVILGFLFWLLLRRATTGRWILVAVLALASSGNQTLAGWFLVNVSGTQTRTRYYANDFGGGSTDVVWRVTAAKNDGVPLSGNGGQFNATRFTKDAQGNSSFSDETASISWNGSMSAPAVTFNGVAISGKPNPQRPYEPQCVFTMGWGGQFWDNESFSVTAIWEPAQQDMYYQGNEWTSYYVSMEWMWIPEIPTGSGGIATTQPTTQPAEPTTQPWIDNIENTRITDVFKAVLVDFKIDDHTEEAKKALKGTNLGQILDLEEWSFDPKNEYTLYQVFQKLGSDGALKDLEVGSSWKVPFLDISVGDLLGSCEAQFQSAIGVGPVGLPGQQSIAGGALKALWTALRVGLTLFFLYHWCWWMFYLTVWAFSPASLNGAQQLIEV